MKKLTTLFALIALLFALSCQKQPTGHSANLFQAAALDSNQAFLQQARTFFTKGNYPVNLSQPDGATQAAQASDSLPYSRTSLHKTALWAKAQVQTFSFGKGIVVPIQVAEPLSVQIGGQSLTANQVTWLFLYREPSGAWHVEVITRIPGAGNTASLTVSNPGTSAAVSVPLPAKVRVENWQGNFLKGYLYAGDSIVPLFSSSTYKRSAAAKPATKTPSLEALELECSVTDWYACSSVGGVYMGCEYEYSTEECRAVGGEEGGGGEAGAPSGSDYGAVGGGGGSSSSATADIKPAVSITGNPIVACVWNHLMSPSLTNGLKSILSSFGDNTVYNVSFTLGTVSGDGMCSYQGNNNFLVTINQSEADDPDYSRIWLASTFIHEAFHAKLRQKALETFGEAAISQWPTPIDDMTLSQLATYFEAESKSENIWESVEHDWMVDNINDLATSLQEFVQIFYPTTYAQTGSSLAPYIALMYMGLQTSTIYQEAVVAQGQQATVENYWRGLNEGGKCQD